jgi:hypothetical protein
MKNTEFRIGNLVYDFNVIHPTEQYVTVAAIYEVGCTLRNDRGLYNVPYPKIKGVILTEEWLLKMGFEVNNGYYNQYRYKDRLIVIRDGKLVDYGTSVILEYVHQLQNLYFALTGEELTFSTPKTS